MKGFTLSSLAALLASTALAAPLDMMRRDGGKGNNGGKGGNRNKGGFSDIDITILQFALTLEHLENTFYQEAFVSFKEEDFISAGFDQSFFTNLQFIAADESAHVEFLIETITSAGAQPVAPCQYNFPVKDVASFVTLSAIFESVGTSAYLGAAPFVQSKSILAAAASVMAVEALHTSQQRTSLGAIGAPDPFQTPLDPNTVFTIASQFIVSCPASNAALPFTAFPGLSANVQPCFAENGNGGSFQTNTVDYASVVQAIETASTSALYANATGTVVYSAATDTAVAVAAASTTTDSVSASTTTVASDSATATAAPAPTKRAESLEARASTGSCAAPGAGSQMQLVPDFSKAKNIDFRRIQEVFVTIISGIEIVSIKASFSGDGSITVILPGNIGGGQVFIFITKEDISGKSFSDNQVLFGPAIMEIAPSLPGFFNQ